MAKSPSKKYLKLSSKEWFYRGEGNANVVLSLPSHRKVLRIRKTHKPKTIFEWLIDFLMQWFQWEVPNGGDGGATLRLGKLKTVLENIVAWIVQALGAEYKNIIYRELRDLKFYKTVVRPILGFAFTCDATSVYISKEQVEEIEKSLIEIRPGHRKTKRLSYGKATILEDLALLPFALEFEYNSTGSTFAIELKPKQGWVPPSERTLEKCQFCSKQYLKLKNGEIHRVTSYCPLDLFSGDRKRMIKSLKALIDNPQNNLRIFQDGTYKYGEGINRDAFNEISRNLLGYASELDDFCDLLLEVLMKRCQLDGSVAKCTCFSITSNLHQEYEKQEQTQGSCDYNQCDLPVGCVLERILFMQKLNQLGFKHYAKVYEKIRDKELAEWGYVDDFLNGMKLNNLRCPGCLIKMIGNKGSEALAMTPYLLAAVAKDCSIMITLKRLTNEKADDKDCIVKTRTNSYLVNIGLLDLYPKPLSTISKSKQKLHDIAIANSKPLEIF